MSRATAVVTSFGAPTVEFTHADMEARGIHVNDLMVDTLIYVDRTLPVTQWAAIAHRLRTEFDPTGADLFSLTDTRLRTLAKWLGKDFRGAIVQISKSGWSHQSYRHDHPSRSQPRAVDLPPRRLALSARTKQNPRAIARCGGFYLVDPSGIEPLTSTMPLWRSPS